MAGNLFTGYKTVKSVIICSNNMNQVLSLLQARKIANNLHREGKVIVLTGGCFDILHPGHFALLRKAKEAGDILFVLLESDEKIKKLKGSSRPIHSQQERTDMLTGLKTVDYILPLPILTKNSDYDDIIMAIRPNIIATTENDPSMTHKQRQASLVNAQVLEVTKYIPHKSTSHLVDLLSKEN